LPVLAVDDAVLLDCNDLLLAEVNAGGLLVGAAGHCMAGDCCRPVKHHLNTDVVIAVSALHTSL